MQVTQGVPIIRQNIVFDEQTEHAPSMLADTHPDRVLKLTRQKGLLRISDLDLIDAPRVVLTRLTALPGGD